MAEDDPGEDRKPAPKPVSAEVPGPDGQTYGQAGGYSSAPGESLGGVGESTASPGGSAGGEGYTGQTGTGYGQTLGGDPRPDEEQPEGLLAKARHAVSGVLGAGEGAAAEDHGRSDDHVREAVNDRLRDDPFLDASHIEVAVDRGHVTLSGAVTARPDKRRAQDLADDVQGVKHVHNMLKIEEASSSEPVSMDARVAELERSIDRSGQIGSMSGNSVTGDPKGPR